MLCGCLCLLTEWKPSQVQADFHCGLPFWFVSSFFCQARIEEKQAPSFAQESDLILAGESSSKVAANPPGATGGGLNILSRTSAAHGQLFAVRQCEFSLSISNHQKFFSEQHVLFSALWNHCYNVKG